MPDLERQKHEAAEAALDAVESGMVVGLGHGSTALYALRGLAGRIGEGRLWRVRVVPSSLVAAGEAGRLGLPLADLDEVEMIDLTIDGADEVAPTLDLIKGAGGALLREKIVAQASAREIIIVDETKLSPGLGRRGVPLPVEVLPFGRRSQERWLAGLGAEVRLRAGVDGEPFRTDQGNVILDCRWEALPAPAELAMALEARAGVLGHGLFLGRADEVIVGTAGGVRRLRRGEQAWW